MEYNISVIYNFYNYKTFSYPSASILFYIYTHNHDSTLIFYFSFFLHIQHDLNRHCLWRAIYLFSPFNCHSQEMIAIITVIGLLTILSNECIQIIIELYSRLNCRVIQRNNDIAWNNADSISCRWLKLWYCRI